MKYTYDFITFSIVDQCNLRCPSCPAEHISANGKLRCSSVELCEKVFKKIAQDYGNPRISLYCLSEPLLHPYLPEVLDAAHKNGLSLEISTNLNSQRDLAPIIEHPALQRFDISLSGFTQKIYQQGHGHGRIELVKKNMIAISKMRHADKVYVKYIKYNDNTDDEKLMQAFAESLGFYFCSFPATYFPYGDILECIADGQEFVPPRRADGLISRLITKDIWKVVPSPVFADNPCYNQERILFINYEGQIFTCNFTTYKKFGHIGDFLQLSAEQIAMMKKNFGFCGQCKALGVQAQNAVKSALENDQELRAFFEFLNDSSIAGRKQRPVYIYGAGLLGRQICSLLLAKGVRVTGFIDDDPTKHGATADGLPVYSLAKMTPEALGHASVLAGMFLAEPRFAELNTRLCSAGASGGLQKLGAFLQSFGGPGEEPEADVP